MAQYDDPYYEEQHRQRMAEDLERINAASRLQEEQAAQRAREANQTAREADNAFYDGLSGGMPPLNGNFHAHANYMQGQQIRQNREAEEAGRANPASVYPHFSAASAPTAPTEEEIAAAKLQQSIKEDFSHSDGYYGVILDLNALGPGLKVAYLKGRKDFIDEQRRNPAFNVPEDHVQQYLRGEGYAPYQAFRTYNPLIAMDKGFYSERVNGKMSDGAEWCHMRGGGIGREYSAFRRDFLDDYEIEFDRREKMGRVRRGLLNAAFPLTLPSKSEYVRHAETFLYMYRWFIDTNDTQPKTGSCILRPTP